MASDRQIGWQEDGSYVPCPQCRYVPPPDPEGPGRVIHAIPHRPGSAMHRGDCPTVPQVSQETRDKLAEMDRLRRKAEVESRSFFIG